MSQLALAVSVTQQPETARSVSLPLTVEEKIRLGQLLRTIERGLQNFLEVSKCLAEIRSGRLYRGTHADFQRWCRETLGLARSSVDTLVRSGEVAQLLIDNGVTLPPNTTEATIRPLARLPGPELQKASWDLIQAASSKAGPTSTVSSKVVRVIQNAIEPDGTNGNGHKPRKRDHPPREQSFISPVRRLAAWHGFDANLVTAQADKFSTALAAFTACRIMADRCLSCCAILAKRYPELTDA